MSKWIAGAVILIVVLAWTMSGSEAVRVQTALVDHRELVVTVQEQGRTRAKLPYIVNSPVAGHMLRTDLVEGDRVEKDQVLAELALVSEDSRTETTHRANLAAAIARRHAAEASLAEAESALERAESEAQRRERLFLDRMIGEEERDAYRQTVQAAQSRLLSVRSSLNAAMADETSARALLMGSSGSDSENPTVQVYAPASGTIQLVHERGDRVIAAGTPLFQISNEDALELIIDLLTQDAVRVNPGDTILITGWGGDDVLMGKVDYVEPQAFTKYSALGVEEQRVNVVGSLLENNSQLGAGYRIEAAIAVWQQDDVLTVPTSALFRRDNSWHVFLIETDTATLRPVRVGQRSRDYAQVLEGLQRGSEVIAFPSDLVQEGVAVERIQ